jgi:hypothetical protein
LKPDPASAATVSARGRAPGRGRKSRPEIASPDAALARAGAIEDDVRGFVPPRFAITPDRHRMVRMTGKSQVPGTKPASRTPPSRTPEIVLEDHTDEATRAELLEVIAAWQWVQAERAQGRLPN